MKNTYINKGMAWLVCIFCINASANAQTITAYRYWFDRNIGAATTVSVTPVLSENLTTSLATNGLSIGYHTITTQFKDANGIYSVPVTSNFVRTGFDIVAYEYWWDANYSAHVTVNVNAAQSVNLSAAIVPVGLDTGLHAFAIRFKDLKGNWSVPLQDTVDVTVFVSGIRELSSVSNITLGPNPTQDVSVLTFDGSGTEVLTMTLTDATGKEVQERQLQNGFALQQYAINTDGLAAGVYFVKLSSGKGAATRKLVVQ